MSVDIHEKIAALAIVATDGEIEILERNPFTAKIHSVADPIMLQSFYLKPAETTVVELQLPIARMPANPEVDRWIARIAPRLFNLHVAVRDIHDGTIIEVRSSLIADGMTVEMLNRALKLLAVGAGSVAEELREVMDSPSLSLTRQAAVGSIRGSGQATTSVPLSEGGRPAPATMFAGYL